MRWKAIKLLRNTKSADEQRLINFVNAFGFDRCAWYERPYSFAKLLAGQHSYNAGYEFDTPSFNSRWLDHGELYKVNGTSLVVAVGHNYGPYEDIIKCATDVAQPLGLRAIVYDRAVDWYYPNKTVLVVYMADETFKRYEHKLLSFASVEALI